MRLVQIGADLHGRPQVQTGHDVQLCRPGIVQPRLEQARFTRRALLARLPANDRESPEVSQIVLSYLEHFI